MMQPQLLQGDALHLPFDDGIAQTCVTSPPYYGLRKYGDGHELGSEKSPDEYVERMVACMREVRRVLRPDGTLWLNLGDSYNAYGRQGHGTRIGYKQATNRASATRSDTNRVTDKKLKQKDLLGIPWRVAFALQADGWYLRSAIVWAKRNPMPESVTDRPTRSYEMVFLMSKEEQYFYDQIAISEPLVEQKAAGEGKHHFGGNSKSTGHDGRYRLSSGNVYQGSPLGLKNSRDVWTITPASFKGAHYAVMPVHLAEKCILAGSSARGQCPECGAPWEPVATGWDRSFFAAVPGWQPTCACGSGLKVSDFDIVKSPQSKVGTGGNDPAAEIGRPGFSRETRPMEGTRPITRYEHRMYAEQLRSSEYRETMMAQVGETQFQHYIRTDRTGARPIPPWLLDEWIDCGYLTVVEPPKPNPHPPKPQIVLDPFMGAGTTAVAALKWGRTPIGVDLYRKNVDLALRRIDKVQVKLV